jgi:hypothetical protein
MLSATVKEAVADVECETDREETAERVLALPDLERVKPTVLNSLTSASGQRTYEHAIREFVAWYCSEPRLAFNRTVVLRYRIHLEQRRYAPATINLRLAAVRRIANEAADAGLLSPELAAGIRRVVVLPTLGIVHAAERQRPARRVGSRRGVRSIAGARASSCVRGNARPRARVTCPD